jgi:predicted nucleic acid-binding protein
MKLLDSNILIYSYLDVHKYLRPLFLEADTFVSEISRLEVLGYHGLSQDEEKYFTDVFSVVQIVEIDKILINEAIRLRRSYKMKLGDSIVAATATLNGLEIYTRNVTDFDKISGLKVVNPVI